MEARWMGFSFGLNTHHSWYLPWHQKQTLFLTWKTCLRSKAPHSSFSSTTPSTRPIFHPDIVSLQLRLPQVLFSIQIFSFFATTPSRPPIFQFFATTPSRRPIFHRDMFLFNYAFHTSYFPSRYSFSSTTPSTRPIFHPDIVSLQLRLPHVLYSIQIQFLCNYVFHTSYFPSRYSFFATTPSKPPIFHSDLVFLQLRLPGVLFSIQI